MPKQEDSIPLCTNIYELICIEVSRIVKVVMEGRGRKRRREKGRGKGRKGKRVQFLF